MRNKSNRSEKKQRPIPNEGYKVGRAIKAEEVRVIGTDGKNLGVMSLDQALNLADETGLDLVQISSGDGVVIAKIMDVGKFLYQKKKQRVEAKKKQKVIEIKELKLRPNIGPGDYKVKISRAVQFLKDGKHVKITLQFRGREIAAMSTMGKEMFERILNDIKENFGQGFEVQKESKGGPFWSKIVVPKAL